MPRCAGCFADVYLYGRQYCPNCTLERINAKEREAERDRDEERRHQEILEALKTPKQKKAERLEAKRMQLEWEQQRLKEEQEKEARKLQFQINITHIDDELKPVYLNDLIIGHYNLRLDHVKSQQAVKLLNKWSLPDWLISGTAFELDKERKNKLLEHISVNLELNFIPNANSVLNGQFTQAILIANNADYEKLRVQLFELSEFYYCPICLIVLVSLCFDRSCVCKQQIAELRRQRRALKKKPNNQSTVQQSNSDQRLAFQKFLHQQTLQAPVVTTQISPTNIPLTPSPTLSLTQINQSELNPSLHVKIVNLDTNSDVLYNDQLCLRINLSTELFNVRGFQLVAVVSFYDFYGKPLIDTDGKFVTMDNKISTKSSVFSSNFDHDKDYNRFIYIPYSQLHIDFDFIQKIKYKCSIYLIHNNGNHAKITESEFKELTLDRRKENPSRCFLSPDLKLENSIYPSFLETSPFTFTIAAQPFSRILSLIRSIGQ